MAELPLWESPLSEPLTALLPLAITEVSPSARTAEHALFEALLRQHHYLSHRSSVGENRQYLAG